MYRVVIFAFLTVGCLCASPSSLPCPFGWSRYVPTDDCYRVWPSNNWNNSVKVRVTYAEATTFCATQSAALPVFQNRTHLNWALNLIGKSSGTAVWLGIKDYPGNNRFPQLWRTVSGHDFTEFFLWDTKQSMPGPEPCVALQAGGNLNFRIPGGNNKMITLDCSERISVMCVKQRVPVAINGVNLTSNGVIQAVWGNPLTLQFIGGRIPKGTIVTLQTTNEKFFNGPPKRPTQCTTIKPLVGDSIPIRLNVSTATFAHKVCNGTCQVATASWPASTPFVRGAQYSMCFFVPIPFVKFSSIREFSQNWIPSVAIEFVQRRSDYLRDVCTRHQQDVNLFLGSHQNDRGRPIVRPYYFDSNVAPF